MILYKQTSGAKKACFMTYPRNCLALDADQIWHSEKIYLSRGKVHCSQVGGKECEFLTSAMVNSISIYIYLNI